MSRAGGEDGVMRQVTIGSLGEKTELGGRLPLVAWGRGDV